MTVVFAVAQDAEINWLDSANSGDYTYRKHDQVQNKLHIRRKLHKNSAVDAP